MYVNLNFSASEINTHESVSVPDISPLKYDTYARRQNVSHPMSKIIEFGDPFQIIVP